MPTNVMAMLQSLSRVQIERLLKAKERIETLQSRRDELRKELAQIEATLGGLLEGTGDVAKTARRPRKSAKKTATKQATRKKIAKKRPAKTAIAAKSGKGRRKVAKKAAKPARAVKATKSGGAGKRATLEDVVVSLIQKRGEPVPFQVLLSTITGKKLFKTRSSNFDNVLRRTLSTSTRVKRVGRGIYGI
jgi:hypothetical protein